MFWHFTAYHRNSEYLFFVLVAGSTINHKNGTSSTTVLAAGEERAGLQLIILLFDLRRYAVNLFLL